MAELDTFAILRSADPAQAEPLDGPDSERGRRILATVMANVEPVPVSGRRRPWRLIVAALVAVGVATAAAWYLTTRPVTDPLGSGCYDSPDLSGSVVVAPPDAPPSVDACRPLWESGILPVDGPPSPTVPPLIGCVTEKGTLAVLPGDDPGLCEELGLLPAGDTVADPVQELLPLLREQINPTTCSSFDDAETVAREMLTRLGLADWTVVMAAEVPGRPCPSIDIRSESTTIRIVPSERVTGEAG